MEKNINVETYLSLNKEGLKQTKKKAEEEAIASYGEEDGGKDLVYSEAEFNAEEVYFEEGCLNINGSLSAFGEDLGYISHIIPLGNDTVMEIMNHYIQKLEKLKDFVESLK